MVQLAHELGLGHAALKKISTVLGIPGFNANTYQAHDKKVTVAEIGRGLQSLRRSRDEIRRAYADLDPEVAALLDADPDAVISIAVSFDGAWEKARFLSHYGIGLCIDPITGLVIDYELLSTYCHSCSLKESAKSKGNITEQQFNDWKETHTDCAKNFDGSREAMEREAARRMWARSVERHQLRYTEMLLSAGDGGAFEEVLGLNPYPGHAIRKVESVDHAYTRMGTALRKWSAKGDAAEGAGKLTIDECETLQNYYRAMIVDNRGTVNSMKNAIWASLLHCTSTDDNPMHDRCNPSWCWYRQAEEEERVPEYHGLHARDSVSKEAGRKLLRVYHRMSSDSLLESVQHGGTGNANQCLKSVIWGRCPQAMSVGKRRVEAAISTAISIFNEGVCDTLKVMEKWWLQSAQLTLETP